MIPCPDGATIFSDLIGKLDVLRVACNKCGRDGSRPVASWLPGRLEARPRSIVG